MITLDASDLIAWQSCRRRWVLASEYHPQKWRPKALWDACLRRAIISIIEQGVSAAEAAADGRAGFMSAAADPGLDEEGDTYELSLEWCGLLDTVLEGLVRHGLPKEAKECPAKKITSVLEWKPLSWLGEGKLHRWVTLDRWDQAAQARELHSWRTIGDIVAMRMPMVLHVIQIGSMREGRRSSEWTRAWKNPVMPTLHMKFKGQRKNTFKGWNPFYFRDSKVPAADWVEQMFKEGAAQDLLHDPTVKAPDDARVGSVLRDMIYEAGAMRVIQEEKVSWDALPMSRNACDGIVPCPYQIPCYAGSLVGFRPLSLPPTQPAARPQKIGSGCCRPDSPGTPEDRDAARPGTYATGLPLPGRS